MYSDKLSELYEDKSKAISAKGDMNGARGESVDFECNKRNLEENVINGFYTNNIHALTETIEYLNYGSTYRIDSMRGSTDALIAKIESEIQLEIERLRELERQRELQR